MIGYFSAGLVLLSILVAVFASYVALDLASRVAAAQHSGSARYWLIGGAVSMGMGIWSMHFIGMLALRLPIAMSYDIPVTLLSLLIAVIVSGFALRTVSSGTMALTRLLVAGLLMGLGIAAMHYVGMAAMQMDPPARYDLVPFTLSILIAVGASIVALWIAFQLRSETILSAFWKKAGSACIMGFAIAGMHYTGMAAVEFAPDSICTVAPQDINNAWLGGTIAVFSFLFLATTLLISVFDARLADRSAKHAVKLEAMNAHLAHQADELARANVSLHTEAEERRRAEEAIAESEARYRDLTELSSDWYWEQDEQFRFTFVSAGANANKGSTVAEVLGKTRREQTEIHMSDEEWEAHERTLNAHEPFYDLAFKRIGADGEERHMLVSGRPIHDAHGNFKGYRGVGKDITERVLAAERIQYLAYHDGLTKLPNRAKFSKLLNHGINEARRNRRRLAVLFIDLDRFKNINDTLGHDAGDLLLQEVGTRLRQGVRQSDTVARLGGDEFVVLLEDVSDQHIVASIAHKLLTSIIKPVTMLGQEFRVTASIGISLYPDNGQDEQTLMKNADIAMYQAKEEGKNNFQFHSGQMDTHSFERLALESSLRRALERSEFQLFYQAKMDLRSGEMTGMEALIRWMHPDLGTISPAQFIPLAEETGLIVPIGKWVLKTACAQNKAWQDSGLPPMCVAVNLSARQFTDENLLIDIAAALRETRLAPEYLELEITESMVMHSVEKAIAILTELKQMGVRLAIDDFGTGYSSLSNLKRFPIDTIKVDRSFIRDIPGDHDDRAITEAIIALGQSLSLTVTAEGVETQAQVDFLRANACNEFQGYYFSRPIARDKFEDLLRLRAEEKRVTGLEHAGALG